MVTFLTGLLGGFLAWIGTTVLGQPIYKFLELRSAAAQAIARFDPYVASSRYVNPEAQSVQWLEARKRDYLTCGVNLRAFAATHAYVAKLLHKCGYYPFIAGTSLIALAYQSPGSEERPKLRDEIASALHLNFDI